MKLNEVEAALMREHGEARAETHRRIEAYMRSRPDAADLPAGAIDEVLADAHRKIDDLFHTQLGENIKQMANLRLELRLTGGGR